MFLSLPARYKRVYAGFFAVLLALVGLGIGLQLVQQQTKLKSKAATIISLDQLKTVTGISDITTNEYNESAGFNATITKLFDSENVFLLNRSNYNGYTDRYDIRFPKEITDIYGLGMYEQKNSTALGDFTDLDFTSGHMTVDSYQSYDYSADIARLKTPIMVMPKEKLIIAYIHPGHKKLKLTRTDTSTAIIMKKNEEIGGEPVGKLLIVKGDTIEGAYQSYYRALKDLDYHFKKPHYNAFGVYWETYNEFGCTPTLTGVQSILNSYRSRGINPSVFTIGSGYWLDNPNDRGCIPGCGATCKQYLTTDSFNVSPERFVSRQALNNFFVDQFTTHKTYPLIGMRQIFFPDKASDQISTYLGLTSGIALLNDQTYYGGAPSDNVKLLNYSNTSVLQTFMNAVKTNYGSIKGIKEDDMLFGNQKRFNSNNQNFMADNVSKAYKAYSEMHNNDFIIFGRNDYFGVETDGQNSQGYLSNKPGGEYAIKYFLDSALSQVFSGYPHPVIEPSLYPCRNHINGSEKETLRTLQLAAFLPITDHSCDYTKLTRNNYITSIDYFSRLRMRFHKYAYDNAMKWYEMGIPSLMRPLNLDNNYNSDNNVYTQYQSVSSATTNYPRNEFMFGNALLVRPVFNSNDSVTVYLPAGVWKPFFKVGNAVGSGNQNYNIEGDYDFPVYFKQGEILIISTPENPTVFQAYVYLGTTQSRSNPYKFYRVNNTSSSIAYDELQAVREGENVYLRNNSTGSRTLMSPPAQYDKGFLVADVADVVSGISIPINPIIGEPGGSSVTPSPTSTPTPTTAPTCLAPSTFNASGVCDSVRNLDTTWTWSAVSGVASYRIQVDNNSDFSSPILDTTTTSTSRTRNDLPPGTYYGRVCIETVTGSCVPPSAWKTTSITRSCVSPSPTTPVIPGDANGDGKVDGIDYIIWLNHYGQTTQGGVRDGDFSQDGKVDGLDYVIWLNNYTG